MRRGIEVEDELIKERRCRIHPRMMAQVSGLAAGMCNRPDISCERGIPWRALLGFIPYLLMQGSVFRAGRLLRSILEQF